MTFLVVVPLRHAFCTVCMQGFSCEDGCLFALIFGEMGTGIAIELVDRSQAAEGELVFWLRGLCFLHWLCLY